MAAPERPDFARRCARSAAAGGFGGPGPEPVGRPPEHPRRRPVERGRGQPAADRLAVQPLLDIAAGLARSRRASSGRRRPPRGCACRRRRRSIARPDRARLRAARRPAGRAPKRDPRRAGPPGCYSRTRDRARAATRWISSSRPSTGQRRPGGGAVRRDGRMKHLVAGGADHDVVAPVDRGQESLADHLDSVRLAEFEQDDLDGRIERSAGEALDLADHVVARPGVSRRRGKRAAALGSKIRRAERGEARVAQRDQHRPERRASGDERAASSHRCPNRGLPDRAGEAPSRHCRATRSDRRSCRAARRRSEGRGRATAGCSTDAPAPSERAGSPSPAPACAERRRPRPRDNVRDRRDRPTAGRGRRARRTPRSRERPSGCGARGRGRPCGERDQGGGAGGCEKGSAVHPAGLLRRPIPVLNAVDIGAQPARRASEGARDQPGHVRLIGEARCAAIAASRPFEASARSGPRRPAFGAVALAARPRRRAGSRG